MPAKTPENPLSEINRDERSIRCLIAARVSSGDVCFSLIESTLSSKVREYSARLQGIDTIALPVTCAASAFNRSDRQQRRGFFIQHYDSIRMLPYNACRQLF